MCSAVVDGVGYGLPARVAQAAFTSRSIHTPPSHVVVRLVRRGSKLRKLWATNHPPCIQFRFSLLFIPLRPHTCSLYLVFPKSLEYQHKVTSACSWCLQSNRTMRSTELCPTFVSSSPFQLSFRHHTYNELRTTWTTSKRRRTNQISTDYFRRRSTSLSIQSDEQKSTKRPAISRSAKDPKSSTNQFQTDSSEQKNVSTNGVASNGIAPVEADQILEPSQASEASGVKISLGSLKLNIPSRWLLFTVPLMWGSFAPAVRLLFSQEPHQDPSVFNSERLLLSTIIYVPILVAETRAFLTRNESKTAAVSGNRFSFFPAGIELGIYVFLANVAQVIGLQQTSASRAAFLVQLQTVIVPVMAGLLGKAKIPTTTWISSLVAVTGVALLSSDKGHGTVASFSGDALEVLSALFFSAYVFRLEKYCNTVAANPLVATKIAVQAVLSIGWALFAEVGSNIVHAPSDSPEHMASWTFNVIVINALVVAWTGLVSSALSGWAQTKGQQGVPASEAVVIFATQPLWASAIAAILLGESFGPRGLGGGALIIAGTLIASRKRKENNSEGKQA